MSEPQGFRIVHAIAQLRFGAGRYVVDTAIAQHRRQPGRVAVVVSEDAEPPWQSASPLLTELRTAGVTVFVGGDFFHRRTATLKAAAATWRRLLLGAGSEWPKEAVVHAHTAMAAAIGHWAGAPRVVLTCHGWGSDRPADIDLQDALAYSICDIVTSPSDGWARTVRERTARELVPVIPYGFDLTRLSFEPQERRPGPARIVTVGELSHRKGSDLLLESMTAVWERCPEAELHFVGDGDLMGTLRARAEALRAGTRVVFHGLLEHPPTILGGFDIFALPSRSDNQPVAIVEAMAAGLPIVSTRIGGIAEMIENARCGFVVPPDTVADLSAVLRVLIDAGDIARRDLGRTGAAYVHAHCDVTTHVDALEVLYRPSLGQTKVLSLTTGAPVRLHIGCNRRRRDGWINIDVRPEVDPDLVARAHELPMFETGSVDVVEACHLLEHLPLHEAKQALREWARVLRSGGELFLELPNLDACVGMLGPDCDDSTRDVAMMGLFGWPKGVECHGDAFAHHWGWSPRSLARELGECGFGAVEEQPLTQTWRPSTQAGADFRVRAVRLAEAEVAA